jgi:Predicted nucleotidyltransferases
MRKIIPQNYVKFDYIGILNSFISLLHARQGDNIGCVYLSGSYARGEATDWSDLDVFCIFHILTPDVLNDVGFAARTYDDVEINAQCMSSNEVNTGDFAGWTEKSARILDSVLLFGKDIFGENVSKTELRDIYKKYLVHFTTLFAVNYKSPPLNLRRADSPDGVFRAEYVHLTAVGNDFRRVSFKLRHIIAMLKSLRRIRYIHESAVIVCAVCTVINAPE